jgi:hypothetical protein
MPVLPAPLSHSRYCGSCFSAEVSPVLEHYEETLGRAKNVLVFFKTRKRGLRVVKREKIPERVDECADRDETILRLAYIAAEKGYGALIEVDVNSKKVRNEGYQSSIWSGSGVAAEVISVEED